MGTMAVSHGSCRDDWVVGKLVGDYEHKLVGIKGLMVSVAPQCSTLRSQRPFWYKLGALLFAIYQNLMTVSAQIPYGGGKNK